MLDTISGLLMFALAVGVVAAVLIAVSRSGEQSIPIDRALVAPAAACSLGAAIVNIWGSVAGSVPGAPPVLVAFLLGVFQAEWAFAVTRPHLRGSVVPAGIAIHGIAVVLGLGAIVLAAGSGSTLGEGISTTDVVAVALELAVLAMLAFVIEARREPAGLRRRIADTHAVELRSVAVATVALLTFLAVAGPGHGHA